MHKFYYTIIFLLLLQHLLYAQQYRVKMRTTQGIIVLQLFDDVPLHKANFIKLVRQHTFDSLLFHRVINKFMIQGGDPDSKRAPLDSLLGNGDLPYKVPAEIMPHKYIHLKGMLAAARDDVPNKESSACQFYIVQGKVPSTGRLDSMELKNKIKYTPQQRSNYIKYGGTPHLDGNYTVFGKVIKGINVVDAIASVPTNKDDRPIANVRILHTKLLKAYFWGLFYL
jgi:cyclophilin family peptidyl-prolyl cis-trans isomerase